MKNARQDDVTLDDVTPVRGHFGNAYLSFYRAIDFRSWRIDKKTTVVSVTSDIAS